MSVQTAKAEIRGTNLGNGWSLLNESQIPQTELEERILRHFPDEGEDLTGFLFRDDPKKHLGLELVSPDQNRGYVFIGPEPLTGANSASIKGLLDYAMDVYTHTSRDRIISYSFIDNKNDTAGFAWEVE